ncbi:hypothetical protein CNYM01_00265 [Colletotrichum nymphaeae SA-01]|uniref:Uncharacterized protein n=1 Tax=Colletotrichum nymphaeae SA-01 TaxID=1460502 RepID=A0A135U7P9_9PEZI|nr:hypothetical protein CNYM01_00265 [Colletotrichum nymphaeae SA-01]
MLLRFSSCRDPKWTSTDNQMQQVYQSRSDPCFHEMMLFPQPQVECKIEDKCVFNQSIPKKILVKSTKPASQIDSPEGVKTQTLFRMSLTPEHHPKGDIEAQRNATLLFASLAAPSSGPSCAVTMLF